MSSNALNELRALLDHFDGEVRSEQLEFFRGVLSAGPSAVLELDGRLPAFRGPRCLRQLAMEASFYFPWPEWVPVLSRVLRHEMDPGTFETGARALGRIGSPEALAVLRELNTLRQGDQFKEVVAAVLTQTDPLQAFNHYMGLLLEGSSNAGVANEAAQRLLPLVDASHLQSLRTLAMHPDLLVFRHALLLLAHVRSPEAAEALKDIFEDSHHEVLADRQLKDALGQVRNLAPAAAREKAQDTLKAVEAGEALELPPVVKTFHREVVAATDEIRLGALPAVLAQTAECMHGRARRLGFAVDATAEGLAGMVKEGLADAGPVLDLLVEAYREQTGREGLAKALARIVPAGALPVHQLLLAGPDAASRAAAVEVLGAREEEALQPALLLACHDPLSDIADRALVFLGRLPGAEDLARKLLRSSQPDGLDLGLRLIARGRWQACVPDLLDVVRSSDREETVLQVVQTLGTVGGALAAAQLQDMLHSGQSARIQTFLAEALRNLGDPDLALTLCAKADQIRTPLLHAIAVEALAAAHPEPGRALAAGSGPLVLQQARKAWMDRNPWGLRLRVTQALQGLCLHHPETWSALSELVRDTVAEKRPPGAWSPDALHLMKTAVRDFARRATAT